MTAKRHGVDAVPLSGASGLPEVDAAKELNTSPETGWPTVRLLPPPTNPLAVARDIIDLADERGMALTWWRGDFYQWTGTHWVHWRDESVDRWLYSITEHAHYMHRGQPADWAPTQKRINDLKHALGRGALQRANDDDPEDGDGTVAFTNGVLDLTSMTLLPHSPDRFNLHCSPFDYTADAACPLWLWFLGEALEHDPERIELLQEIFGYLLCGGTELQKIFSLFGPKRCGKGTVLRVLVALVGKQHIAAPSTLDSIAGNFGMAQFIGRRLAMLGDVQWTGSRLSDVVGILLGISGEDPQTVARKNKTDWCGTLPTRFLVAGNDRPKFNNASGALAGRMLHIRFRRSFYGREDPTLTSKLLGELSGIFNWALAGWRRLQANDGKFTESKMGVDAAAEVERSASPIQAFVRDMCAEEGHVDLDDLYREYERWRKTEDLEGSVGKPAFSQKLQSVLPMIEVVRVGSSRLGRTRTVYGLRLLAEHETAWTPAKVNPGAGPADPTGPGATDDLSLPVSAGSSLAGPDGPDGPDPSLGNQVHCVTSSERLSLRNVESDMGTSPGPVGSALKTGPTTCGNSGPGDFSRAGSGFDPELWLGFDTDQPPNPDDGYGP